VYLTHDFKDLGVYSEPMILFCFDRSTYTNMKIKEEELRDGKVKPDYFNKKKMMNMSGAPTKEGRYITNTNFEYEYAWFTTEEIYQ